MDRQNLDVDAGYCIVVTYVSGGGKVAKFRYEENGNPMTANTHFMKSSDGGATWSDPVANQDLRFFVYGTETTN